MKGYNVFAYKKKIRSFVIKKNKQGHGQQKYKKRCEILNS